MRLHQTGPSRRDKPSIISLPVDHVVQRPAIAITLKVLAEALAASPGSAPHAPPPAVPASPGPSADRWLDGAPRFRCSRFPQTSETVLRPRPPTRRSRPPPLSPDSLGST